MMANTIIKKIPHWILMPLVMTRRRSMMSLVKALTTLMVRAIMSLVKALIVLIVLMRTMMSLIEALPILILMRILYHIQIVNNLCGYLGLLMWDSESYSDPANVGAITPLFCQDAVNPANAGVDAPIYPILDLGLISPTNALITTLGIQLLPLDVPSFLYQNQHSFYCLFFL